MKIAYIILAHKYPQQLIQLINKIDSKNSSFFVHIDKSSDQKIHQIISNFSQQKTNVYLIKSQTIDWGTFSIVSATLAAFSEVFNRKIDFDYLKLLSGQDYPIKSMSKFEHFLCNNKNKSFIEYFPIPSERHKALGEEDGGLSRIKYWHSCLRISNTVKYIKIPKINHKFPQGLQPFIGSQFWCLSRECAEYINMFVKNNRNFIDFFKYVNIPDEIFFQTIIMNSSLKDQVINNDLTYIDWSAKLAHPKIIDSNDFQNLLQSSAFFARKFDITQDHRILEMIDEKLILQSIQ